MATEMRDSPEGRQRNSLGRAQQRPNSEYTRWTSIGTRLTDYGLRATGYGLYGRFAAARI